MKLTALDIIGQLERLAAAFPWDSVSLKLDREPGGTYRFVAMLDVNLDFGLEFECRCADTPAEAIDELIKDFPDRNPEAARQKKVRELKEQIEKLQAVVIGLPPYRPNRELSNGEPAINIPHTIETVATITA